MNRFVFCLISVGILCGCRPSEPAPNSQRWQYKVVVWENDNHAMHDEEIKSGNFDVAQFIQESGGEFTRCDLNPPDDVDIHKLGNLGWDLVATIPELETVNTSKGNFTRTGKILLIFKKPAA